MNNTFNIKRFGLVLSKDFQEKWKKYILQFLVMFGIMAVIFILYVYKDGARKTYLESDNRELLELASFMFLIFSAFFSSTLMEPMREKTGRITYLTLPASNFEKFFSRWLIVTIGYIIAFFIALWMADAVKVSFSSYYYPELDIRFLDFDKLINPEYEDNYSNYTFFSKYFFGFCIGIYTLIQSLFILGATFWEKNSSAKTFSVGIVIVILFIYLNKWLINIVHQNIEVFGHRLNVVFQNTNENTVLLIATGILVFFTLLCWGIAFLRFCESEIIKRL